MYTARILGIEDKAVYNDFIAVSPKGHFAQLWEWGDIKESTTWEPIRILVEKDGQAKAALSILKRKIPKTGYSIFYASRGPVTDIKDYESMDFLWQEVAKLAKVHKAVMLKIDPDVPVCDKEFSDYLKSRGFISAGKGEGFEGIQPKFVFRLDLTPDEENLFENMHQKTRYNIRLAIKKGVTIREITEKKDLDVFYNILKVTAERDNFLIRTKDYFSVIWDKMADEGYARFFLAEYEGQVIAGTLAMHCGDKVWYLYGASSNEHRNVMPNYLLQWTMIKWAKSLDAKLYDFRGVSGDLSEDNPLYGLYRFKKGFNGEMIEFIGEKDLVYKRLLYNFFNFVEPIYSKAVRIAIRLKKKIRGNS